MMEELPLSPAINWRGVFLTRSSSMVSWQTLRSSAAMWASYSAITLASASSSFRSPRSNCVSNSCMRFAETPYFRCESRRPMTPFRISWQSYNLNGVECRRYGLRDFMSLLRLRPAECISFSGSCGPARGAHSITSSVLRGNQQARRRFALFGNLTCVTSVPTLVPLQPRRMAPASSDARPLAISL